MDTGSAPGVTQQQRQALAARGVSVALSAGAGCGKTFVLTRRFLAQLEPPAGKSTHPPRLGELVAITFTERAAREMRGRIRQACTARLLEAPDEQFEHWLGLCRELDSARVSTIHSFCVSLLRAHAVESGLDPHFRVLQQSQADTLLYELIDDQLRARLAAGDEVAIDLVVQFGLERLREMIRVLLGRRQEIDWEAWRGETPQGLVARWESHWRSVTLPGTLGRLERSPQAQTLLRIARAHRPDHPLLRERLETLAEKLAGLAASVDPQADLAVIREHARVQGVGIKLWPDDAVYFEFRDAAAELRKRIDKVGQSAGFDPEAAMPAAAAGLRLLELAGGVAEAYQAENRVVAGLDFNDLLIEAARLLTGPAGQTLRRRLASQIRLLLVDEFQDTDPLQVQLVKALCDDGLLRGKLFFVGDYKQSIYRFRGADPHVFQELRRSLPEEGRLPLTLNFRSQPAVLALVNALFCEDLGDDYEPLEAHRPQVSPTPAVEMLWAADEEPGGRAGQKERIRRREADWIARRVRALLDSEEPLVWDQQSAALRRVRPGDVALLFRALSDVQYYEEALRRYEIDYYLVGGHAFYAQQEIYDLLNLLRALASPGDEVSLAGVLRSPFFSLQDETLFWLAQHPEGLGGGLLARPLPRALSDQQRRRADFAARTLSELRSAKDRMPIAALVQHALDRTGYDAVLLGEFLGERKLANLRKLIDQARSFDRSGMFTLADFITQLAEFVARQPDEPLAATHPESTDVVRLMTIHQAKGLEFPVVIVPDVDRPTRGGGDAVAFTPELGPMVRVSGQHESATVGLDLHLADESEEDRAELIRLFYVATTRAADRLILSSGVAELGKPGGPWTELLYRRFDPQTGACRATLPEGYRAPEVRVTTSEPPIGRKPSAGRIRRDLDKLADKALDMAAKGAGRTPEHLGPVAADRAARRQYSFSRLSGALHARPAVGQPVDATEEETPPDAAARIDPLGLGTLVHAVLAEIDFGSPADVAGLAARHAPQHLPGDDAGRREAVELIGRFLGSPRAAEIAAAREVYPEVEFLLAWPPGSHEPEGRYLQGFIDCLYQDAAGRWCVLDYKTNRATARTLAEVAAAYEMQMLVYGLAVERILGQPPAALVLHFLRPGLEVQFALDDAARKRVVELVEQGIAALAGQSD